MRGPIFDYIYDEINKLDKNFNIINRKFSSFDKDENTNYRKMKENQTFNTVNHIKLFESNIYTDNFFYIKKIMFSLFEIFEFRPNLIFLFSRIENGFSKLYIYEKGEENINYYHCDNDLIYHITTDNRKRSNFSEYLSFSKEFEQQKNIAIERDNYVKLKKEQELKDSLFQKEKSLALKEQHLKELELKQKESLLKEQQLLELKKIELEKIELEYRKSLLQREQEKEKEKELLLFQQSSRVLKKTNPKLMVVKVTKNTCSKSNVRRSPRLKSMDIIFNTLKYKKN